ncbi:MAG: FkbM family methyltransferase [Propionibacteriales bacterium]|nr:FkbM family methyltransferase [Propionibacteriales bacterium]
MLRVEIRPGTSDRQVFAQVFLREDYRLERLARHAELSALYRQICDSGRTPLIIDCGANNGMATSYFTDAYPAARIIAVEPDGGNLKALRRNTDVRRVKIVQGAVASTSARLSIQDPTAEAWAFRVSRDPGGDVQAFTVRDLLALEPDSVPFMIKIDIEGFEEDLFSANTGWIARFPLLVVELHDWMLPGQRNSRSFLAAMAAADRDFVFHGENVFSIANDRRPPEATPLHLAGSTATS